MLSHFSLSDSATLWTIVRQAPLSMGFSRQQYWGGWPSPPPGDLPNPGIEFLSLLSPALPGGFFTTGATWEAQKYLIMSKRGMSWLRLSQRFSSVMIIVTDRGPTMFQEVHYTLFIYLGCAGSSLLHTDFSTCGMDFADLQHAESKFPF